jgi:aryl-alcohol dehydrogenase-like predicted oxidoreductase
MWQVSGSHGQIDPEKAVGAMFAYHDAGFTTWDLADHYGPAEDLIGEFRRRLAVERPGEAFQALTKWVPQPGPVNEAMVERAIDRSLQRMDVDALDALQLHWWDYDDPSYLDALGVLNKLHERGLIRHVALTNFDTARLRIIVEHGIPIVSNQVQYSMIDRRPEVEMAAYCQDHGIGLLTYGTVLGGLLSDKSLGAKEPMSAQLNTASLRKYKQMIDAWGGWNLLQELLIVLDRLAAARGVSIANIAIRYILDRPVVAGVIIGARLGIAQHIEENARTLELRLDEREIAEIDAVLDKGRDLYKLIGDCGDEYRR